MAKTMLSEVKQRSLLFNWLMVINLLFISSSLLANPTASKRTSKPHLVELTTAEKRPVTSAHERTGTLKARRRVEIHNQEEGRITDLPLFEGDPVTRGQLLVKMDDLLLTAQLRKTRANRKQAEVDLKRLQKLRKKRAVSEDELARSETALEVARADQLLLETRLGYTTITAPFSGIVSTRRIEPGDVVSKHSHLLTVIDPDSLVTQISISELLLPHIKRNDTVSVRIDALGVETHPGRILRIHPELDPLTHQGTVEIILDPVPEGARAGQFARVTLESARVDRIMIPFAAVQRDRDGEYVFRISDEQKAQRTTVHSGMRIADQIEIIEGIKPGEQIIIRGFLGLVDGKKVEPVSH
ncbi:MAG: efflux RND transporter periplasmic adaptor subunit [Gammaproteobacteria bacterium]|nr:efflux RND transporter periplasmic adaptor subunit [Gammaproteobacteria bacterium]